MIPNYPYFGLPNYMRYMGPNMYINPNYTYVQPQHPQSTVRSNNSSSPQNINKASNNNSNNDFKNTFNSSFNSNSKNNCNNNLRSQSKNNFSNTFKNQSKNNSQNKFNNVTNNNSQDYLPLFSILGFDLYFDDILLLCIIFFLYNEHVNEPYLFLTLVLLLLN